MSYQSISLTANTTLSWSYPAIPNLATIADINDINPQNSGFTLTLPAANNVGTGTTILFNNVNSTHSFTLVNNAGVNILSAATPDFEAGQVLSIYLTNNSTAAGQWTVVPFGGGQIAITGISFISDGSILISPTSVPSTDNKVKFQIASPLQNFSDIGKSGIPVILEPTSLVCDTFEIESSDSNIIVTNGSAIANNQAANPSISLNTTIKGITQLTVGTFKFSNSNCDNTLTDNNLNFTTSGTGLLNFNGLTVDATGNAVTLGNISTKNLTVTGTITSPGTASAWCSFADPSSGSYPVTVPITSSNGFNVATVTCVNPGVYQVNFPTATPLPNTTYATVATLTRGSGSVAPYQVFVQAQQKEYVSIYTVDTLGNLIPAIYGISVVIFATN